MAFEKIKSSIDERLGLSEIDYEIPASANSFGYMLGSSSLFVLFILGITGVILGLFYQVGMDAGYESIVYISSDPILQFIRSMHWWAANLIPVLMMMHLTRVIVTGSYKKPREINYYIGVILFAVILMFAFFPGMTLAMTQEGYEGLSESNRILRSFGIRIFPEGGIYVYYFIHVMLAPVLILLLFSAHALYIRIHKITPLPGHEEESTTGPKSTFFHHMKVALLYWAVIFVFLAVLSILMPRTVPQKPIYGIEVTLPPWIFNPTMTFETLLKSPLLTPLPLAFAFLLLFLVPIIDRDPNRNPLENKKQLLNIAIVLFIVFVIFLGLNTALMFVREPKLWTPATLNVNKDHCLLPCTTFFSFFVTPN